MGLTPVKTLREDFFNYLTPGGVQGHLTPTLTVGFTMCYSSHMVQQTVICQVEPDMWFSKSESKKSLAKDLCSECFFQETCLEIAVNQDEVHGIWGGVDFSDPNQRISSSVKRCRKGHELPPEGGSCYTCRRISQKKYDKKIKKNYTKIKVRKNVEGGYCINDHLLDTDNITIRSSDGSIMCRKCYSGNKIHRARAYINPGDFS